MSEDRQPVGPSAPLSDLRPCRCCDDSPNRHASQHFRETGHPIIEGYDPPEHWGWCYVDEVFLDLSEIATEQDGPIPKFV